MGESGKVPENLRVLFTQKLWEALTDFAESAGRSRLLQFKFFLEAAAEAGCRVQNRRLVPEKDWGKSPGHEYRSLYTASEEILDYLRNQQELEDVRYTEVVRQLIAVALEVSLESPECYGITKEILTRRIVHKYGSVQG